MHLCIDGCWASGPLVGFSQPLYRNEACVAYLLLVAVRALHCIVGAPVVVRVSRVRRAMRCELPPLRKPWTDIYIVLVR